MSLRCTTCAARVFHCPEYDAVYLNKNGDPNTIKDHMRNKHECSTDVNPISRQKLMPFEEDACPLFAAREIHAKYDNDSIEGDYDHINCDSQEDMANFPDIGYDETIEILRESFSPVNLTLDGHKYPPFVNDISNTYFE